MNSGSLILLEQRAKVLITGGTRGLLLVASLSVGQTAANKKGKKRSKNTQGTLSYHSQSHQKGHLQHLWFQIWEWRKQPRETSSFFHFQLLQCSCKSFAAHLECGSIVDMIPAKINSSDQKCLDGDDKISPPESWARSWRRGSSYKSQNFKKKSYTTNFVTTCLWKSLWWNKGGGCSQGGA